MGRPIVIEDWDMEKQMEKQIIDREDGLISGDTFGVAPLGGAGE